MDNSIKNGERRSVLGFMIGLIAFSALFALGAFFIAVILNNHFSALPEGRKFIGVSGGTDLPAVIIDPGHGGEDGGSSSGEVIEKDLNLSVSEDLYYLFEFAGVPAKMTRKHDTALYDLYGDLEDYSGKKKVYDLKNRVRFVTEEGGGIYLGIHMNKFPQEKYRGLQVYYSPNSDGSRTLAETIRSGAKTYLAPENEREVKRATSSIYVLDRLRVPAVLVECGFLSNPDELSLLTDPEYRQKMASVIFSSVCSYLSEESAY